jgi:2-polyprenyl-3-methyl-5-hydroxy-6-metoxy-1,4-benzoquinol methylase
MKGHEPALEHKVELVRELEGQRTNHTREMYKRESHCNRFAKVLQILTEYVSKNTLFLDVGCAEGLYCAVAKTLEARRVVGIDISETKLDRARRSCMGEFYQMNCEKSLEPLYGSFNFIICSETLQHLLDYRKAVDEILKCIDRKGYILITTSNLSKHPFHEKAKINGEMSTETLLQEVGGAGFASNRQGSVWKFNTTLLEKELTSLARMETIKRIGVDTPDGKIKELFTVLLLERK